MTYIFLDTCVIIDCAYSRNAQSNPSLLDRLLDLCGRSDVSLLLPEVVLLELPKVAEKTEVSTAESLSIIKGQVDEASKSGVLSGRYGKRLKGDIDQVRRSIVADSREAIERVLALEQDRSRALVLRVSDVDLIEAVKIAVAGEKPSRGKGEWGLLQDDCLIVAALERFMRGHAEDRIVLCSGNTSDFAEGPKGSRRLHHDIAGRFRDAVYFENPVECIQLLEADLGETGRAELAQLGEAYERVSAARVPEGLLVMANVIEHISEAMEKERQAFEENRGIVAGLMAFAQAVDALRERIDAGWLVETHEASSATLDPSGQKGVNLEHVG